MIENRGRIAIGCGEGLIGKRFESPAPGINELQTVNRNIFSEKTSVKAYFSSLSGFGACVFF